MSRIRRFLRAALLAFFPTALVRPLVNRMGYAIGRNTRIGFSLITVDKLTMLPASRIGHFNRLKGPMSVHLDEGGALGHLNNIGCPADGIVVGSPVLTIGAWSKITGSHYVDVTASITIGRYSTIAGIGSQLWTHGYVHDREGPGRYRIDGEIVIGDNVSIGSRSVISMGVTIGDQVAVGAGSTVAKSLPEPGLYVSSALRCLPRAPEPDMRPDLERVSQENCQDVVYRKRGP